MAEESESRQIKSIIGGARVAGQMSAAGESTINKDKEVIKKKWGLAQVEDAFPNSIKPISLGQTAISKLKTIAIKVNSLPAAQALFLREAKKSDGTPIPFGFTHAARIVESLKETTTTPDITTGQDSKRGPDGKFGLASTSKLSVLETTATASKKSSKLPEPAGPAANLKAPTAIMTADSKQKATTSKEASRISQKSPITPSMSKKRSAQKAPSEVEEETEAKKARMDPPTLSPKKLQHNDTIAQPKSAMKILKRSDGSQIPSKDNGSIAAPTEEEKSPLSKMMAEHVRRNEEFFARSEARQAMYATDTIRVAHPSDVSQSPSKNEPSKSKSPFNGHDLRSPSPGILDKNCLKEECLKLSDAVKRVIDVESLYDIARPDQRRLVDEVKRTVNKAVHGLKADIEYIFDTAETG